jgi:hypothetical protein
MNNKLYKIQNQTELDTSLFEELANVFVPYHQAELQWRKPVNINLVSDQENGENPLGKTAYYDPQSFEIVLYTDQRHIKDILRSLSHELVHHYQNCKGALTAVQGEDPQYAQNDDNLRKCEEEAYLLGNMLFRDWEDGYKNSSKLNESIGSPDMDKYKYLVTWNKPKSDDLFVVEYPKKDTFPNDNDFKTNFKIFLRRYFPHFKQKGVLTFWGVDRSVNFTPEIYQPGELVPAAAIDFGIAGDYKALASQNTVSKEDMFKLIKETITSFKDNMPEAAENEIIASVNLRKTHGNRKWVGTIKYGKNDLKLSYFWTTVGTNFFIVVDSNIYGTELIDATFENKKEARKFVLRKIAEIDNEVSISAIETYQDTGGRKNSKNKRRFYESVEERELEHKSKTLERLYKRFNINKGEE